MSFINSLVEIFIQLPCMHDVFSFSSRISSASPGSTSPNMLVEAFCHTENSSFWLLGSTSPCQPCSLTLFIIAGNWSWTFPSSSSSLHRRKALPYAPSSFHHCNTTTGAPFTTVGSKPLMQWLEASWLSFFLWRTLCLKSIFTLEFTNFIARCWVMVTSRGVW